MVSTRATMTGRVSSRARRPSWWKWAIWPSVSGWISSVSCSLTCGSSGVLLGRFMRSYWIARVWRTVLRFRFGVVEGQGGQLGDRVPLRGSGAGAGAQGSALEVEQREVADGDDALLGIAAGVAKGVELLQVEVGDARLFFQLAARGAVERLLRL